MKYSFTKITAHNLVNKNSPDERHVIISSGFDREVLVVKEDAYGDLSIDRIPVKQCEKKFGVKLTKESHSNGRRRTR